MAVADGGDKAGFEDAKDADGGRLRRGEKLEDLALTELEGSRLEETA